MNRPEAIEILKSYKRKEEARAGVFTISDNTWIAPLEISQAIDIAIQSMQGDSKARKEAKRFKRKYLRLRNATAKTVFLILEILYGKNDSDQIRRIVDENLGDVLKIEEDPDDTTGS